MSNIFFFLIIAIIVFYQYFHFLSFRMSVRIAIKFEITEMNDFILIYVNCRPTPKAKSIKTFSAEELYIVPSNFRF